MTNYNERLDEILSNYVGRLETYKKVHPDLPEHVTHDKAYALHVTKQAITSLIKELVEEAKPAEKEQQLTSRIDNGTMCRYHRYGGYNFAIGEFEQNLLKALEEV